MRRGRLTRAVLAGLLVGTLVAPTGAAAVQPSDGDLQNELRDVDEQARTLDERLTEQERRVAAAEEDLAEIGARLEDARGQLRAAEGQLALAEAALEEAEQAWAAAIEAAEIAAQELADAIAELESEEATLADQVIAAYKFGSVGARAGSAAFDVFRRAQDPNDLAVGMHQIGRVIDHQGSTVQSVLALRDERTRLSNAAARAQAAAAQAASDAADRVRYTEQRRVEAADLARQVADEERAQAAVLDRLRADTASIEDALERVAARQAELSAELAARRRAAELARQAAEAQERAASGRATGSGSSGGPAINGVCPVVGAKAGRDFSNDWGAPRSGGRSHQGNDVFAARGAPVVAIADAVIVRMNAFETGLGGITITYRTGDGSEWYNAHLQTIAPGMAVGVHVSQGQTVGTVGNTGNARTTPPHNHIGRRYNGRWVNPWPTISVLC